MDQGWGADQIDKLGFFLRALSAVYSRADRERLVDSALSPRSTQSRTGSTICYSHHT